MSEILSMYDLYPYYIGGFSCYCLLLPQPTLKSDAAPRCGAAAGEERQLLPLRFRSRARQPQQGTGRMWCLEEKRRPSFGPGKTKQFLIEVTNIYKYLMKKRKVIFPNYLCSEQIYSFSGVLNFLKPETNIAVSKRP